MGPLRTRGSEAVVNRRMSEAVASALEPYCVMEIVGVPR